LKKSLQPFLLPMIKKQDVQILDFKPSSIDEILEIEHCCFDSPWSKEMFLNLPEQISRFKTARIADEKIAGYCLYNIVAEQADILSIAVHPLYRRQGFAFKLMENMIKDCFAHRVEEIFLEAAISNVPALNLYAAFGFEKISIRKNYYENEDAFTLRKTL
jgi:ribosomal-protein-alanine N-acetyltransferase